MLDPATIHDLNKAFTLSPGGFLVVEEGMPRFAVLDYKTFKMLKTPRDGKRKFNKILVTGGAGYIGSCVARVLQKEGHEVAVYDNLSTGRKESAQNCKLVVGDLADRPALRKLFAEEKVDAVLHFAASIEAEESVRNPAKYFENNVTNSFNLIDTMLEYNVTKIVFSSTAAVYGEPKRLPITEQTPANPSNPYGQTKFIFERALKSYYEAYGVDSISLRYFNAAGAWPEENLGYNNRGRESHLIPRVMNVACGRKDEIEVFGQDYATPDGSGVRDYVHVRDLADAHILALERLDALNGAYVYNVGTGRGYSVLEVIDEAMEITGRMIPIKFMPRRDGDAAKLVADSSKLQKDLGWRPKFGLREIIESSWTWHNRRA